MAGEGGNDPYREFRQVEDYNVPDLTRRLPIHDDYNRKPPAPIINQTYHSHDDATHKSYTGSGVMFVSLVTENLLSHPFLVLRRQCQVNHNSRKYHLQPFTLIPTICHLQQHQGLTTLWKGLGSVLLVRGMSLGIEDLISKVTPLPKDIGINSGLKQFFKHILLKCVTFAIVTPFYSASFVETVQSEIASEKPGILDVFREGFIRLLNWGAPTRGRMLPIWALIVPTVTLGLAKYLFSMLVRGITSSLLELQYRRTCKENGAVPKNLSSQVSKDIDLTASVFATIASDVVFYPCETIVHRLHLQGTRTIVDNLDSGRSVLPILTNYSGARDCYEKCVNQEGIAGLYKGFGALILQYTAHITLIRMSKFVLTEIGAMMQPKPKPPTPVDNSPPVISNVTTSPKSYLIP